ncbi:MAG: hypothetical protein E6614_01300 [Bradyrhizobium sp.]|uniref:hypothetical protein n=1 Tax=Bradyrhizobium TaxID=374 RepID=UPI001FCB2A3C|nr:MULTISPECIES: hypothetical protein [unclassified Bradyrhizobium]MDU0954289.1 hypothetical protein [Bradyrhizobium sp.]MDU1491284.1 hypothetical protein [Bradyrhizobium sp.]MDU1541462.1 hypothetical protein [Bradyrhizobium sp.]MDU1667150.1 hypothetical protein [Bradyrhizobium sp.]MDU1805653.1 hypothetical protein [Bradyrhizobium sp.]
MPLIDLDGAHATPHAISDDAVERSRESKGQTMARETIYVVQAFSAGRGGHAKAEPPIACKTEASALRTAERLVSSKAGVVAFSSSGDPDMGDYDDEPKVLFRHGALPPAFD